MFLNDIDFPNQILDAIQNNNLVVFAGAGVSKGEPTSLPGFKDLANIIAEGTGEKVSNGDPEEVFLGKLKSERIIDVNSRAAEYIANQTGSFNSLHKAIIDLFKKRSDIRIVTTNYDGMFEKVLEADDNNLPVYNAPALPLGNDFKGIVHIHGNTSDPQYMVLTDEDFGRAYLIEGYVSRFLVKLFETYTVLFIGYSCKDIFSRYLIKAISRNTTLGCFIITDDKDFNWELYGIKPIYYPKEKHEIICETIEKLGVICKRGILDLKKQFEEIKECPPFDLTSVTFIESCLENKEKAYALSLSIDGGKWLRFLEQRGVFCNLFSKSLSVTDYDCIWAEWIKNKIVGKEDSEVIRLIYSNGNQISSFFADRLIHRIINDNNTINDNYLSQYILWFEDYLDESWQLQYLIEITAKRNMPEIVFRLFLKLVEVKIVLKKSFWPNPDSLEYEHTIIGDFYSIERAWSSSKDILLNQYGKQLLVEFYRILEKIYEFYYAFGQASNDDEPWNLRYLIIEDREKNYKDDWLVCLVNVIVELSSRLEEKNADEIISLYQYGMQSNSKLLNKVVLKCIRLSKAISPKDKLAFLLNNTTIDFSGSKEQIYLLIASIFDSLTDKEKSKLICFIEEISPYQEKKKNDYYRFQLCVLLKRKCKSDSRIDEIINRINENNSFAPKEHPECDFVLGFDVNISDAERYSKEDLQKMEEESLLKLLLDYNENSTEKPFGNLLNAFSSLVGENYKSAKGIIDLFVKNNINASCLWSCLINAVSYSKLTLEERILVLEDIVSSIHLLNETKEIANLLFSIVQHEHIKDEYRKYEDRLLKVSKIIWNQRKDTIESTQRAIDTVLNTTVGIVLHSWIYMASYSDSKLSCSYKSLFEEGLHVCEQEIPPAICVIAGHFNFFYSIDPVWSNTYLVPLLCGEKESVFDFAWEGMAFFSHSLYRGNADIMESVLCKSVIHINCLKDKSRKCLIDLFLLLMVFYVENPIIKHVPLFYRSASNEDKATLIAQLNKQLKLLDIDETKNLWDSWLMQFIQNRIRNVPNTLNDLEWQTLFSIVLSINDVLFDEVIKLICQKDSPKQVDSLFLYKLKEDDVAIKHPNSSAKLLTWMLNSGTDFSFVGNFFEEYFSKNKTISEKEKVKLQEALIKRGINY